MRLLIFATLFAIMLISNRNSVAEPPSGYDGMVRIADDTFLFVRDFKTPRSTEPRVGVLTVSADSGVQHEPIAVDDWKHDEGLPNDLESCCAIPGRPSEYLLSESGMYKGKFGRVFHVRLSKEKDGWKLIVLGVMKDLFKFLNDNDGSTYRGEQVEGTACILNGDELILVFSKRGGQVKKEIRSARLFWGILDLEIQKLTSLGNKQLVNQNLLGDRGCSDLLLVPGNGSFHVWSVATIDTGDLGPFRSVVYRAGALLPADNSKDITFARQSRPTIHADLQGLKVESLALPARSAPRSVFSIGTDDEAYGGVWRPLFE